MVIVRRYHPRDCRRVWALSTLPNIGRTADPTLPIELPLPEGPPAEFPHLADVDAAFHAAGGDLLVVESDGHIVAMGGIRPNTLQQAEVLHIRVHPATRRQGIGRELMHALERRAVDLGFDELHLDTATNQPEAVAFYEGLGYRRVGEETRPEWSWTLVYFTKQTASHTGPMTVDAALLTHLADDVGIAGEVLLMTPEAGVNHCPGWTVADLIRHHGGVHRWATKIVETGEPADSESVGPDDVAELATWYAVGASRLIDALSGTDPTRACWTFGRPPGKAWFWTRRQALEAAVHRWDAQTAVGIADGFPMQILTAGITETVEDLFPRQIELGRTAALSAPVMLCPTDLDRRWTMPGGPQHTPAEIAGPADVLFLLLWGRADLDDPALTFFGSDEMRAELQAAQFAP